MKTQILFLIGLGLVLSACSKTPTGVSQSSSVTPGIIAPIAPPTVSDISPLALQIYTNYEGTQANIYQNFLESGTPLCQVTPTARNITCTIQIPEGRLYFSQMHFQFAWHTAKCKLMTFQPYFYKASAVDYLPPWSTSPVLCGSAAVKPAACWGGAAPYISKGFPQFTGNIYIPDETIPAGPQTHTEDLPSAHSLSYNSSRLSVNDLPLAKRATNYAANVLGKGVSEPYIANTFVDYSFVCQDDWYDPVNYSIQLNILKFDSAAGNPVIDDFYSWKEAP